MTKGLVTSGGIDPQKWQRPFIKGKWTLLPSMVYTTLEIESTLDQSEMEAMCTVCTRSDSKTLMMNGQININHVLVS